MSFERTEIPVGSDIEARLMELSSPALFEILVVAFKSLDKERAEELQDAHLPIVEKAMEAVNEEAETIGETMALMAMIAQTMTTTAITFFDSQIAIFEAEEAIGGSE